MTVLASGHAEPGAFLLAGGAAGVPTTVGLQWEGPFSPGELFELGTVTWQDVLEGQVITVTPTQEASLLASDPSWWVVSGGGGGGTGIDGGSASPSFSGSLDGGSASSSFSGSVDGGSA